MDDEEPIKILSGFTNLSRESATCMSCHREKTPGIYDQWGHSKHFGANVGCFECHKADKSEKDAIMHKDFVISVIVSPQDCARIVKFHRFSPRSGSSCMRGFCQKTVYLHKNLQ